MKERPAIGLFKGVKEASTRSRRRTSSAAYYS